MQLRVSAGADATRTNSSPTNPSLSSPSPHHLPVSFLSLFLRHEVFLSIFPPLNYFPGISSPSRGSGATVSGSAVPTFPAVLPGERQQRTAPPSVWGRRFPHDSRTAGPFIAFWRNSLVPLSPEVQIPGWLPHGPHRELKEDGLPPTWQGRAAPRCAPTHASPRSVSSPRHVVIPSLCKEGRCRL